jgi:hypothetical protein
MSKVKVIFNDGRVEWVKPNLAFDLMHLGEAEIYQEDKQMRPKKKGKKNKYRIK